MMVDRIGISRARLGDILADLADRIDEDRVTRDDDWAISSCNFLRYYLLDHMTEGDFEEEDVVDVEVEDGGLGLMG